MIKNLENQNFLMFHSFKEGEDRVENKSWRSKFTLLTFTMSSMKGDKIFSFFILIKIILYQDPGLSWDSIIVYC